MESLVKAQLEAYNQRNLEQFCDCYHSDVKVLNLLSNKIICLGLPQFKEIYQRLFESSPNLHARVQSRVVLEHTVIDEEIVSGMAKTEGDLHTVVIYGFRDGKIDRVWFAR